MCVPPLLPLILAIWSAVVLSSCAWTVGTMQRVPDIILEIVKSGARFVRYYCNKFKKYTGSPEIAYENPNEKLGEIGMLTEEEGEHRCRECNTW